MITIEYPLAVLLGVAILALLSYDIFKTVVQSSEGPIALMVQSLVQRLLSQVFHLTKNRAVLIWASSFLIVSLVVIWIVLLYIGWFAIFSSDTTAIVKGSDQSPASFAEQVYFTGFTISTLGVGDYIPNGSPWQVITTLSALSGFTLVTFIISFLISVAQKQSLRRKLALHIHYLGETPQDIVKLLWDSEQKAISGDALSSVFSDLVQFYQQQLDQPILNRFHGPSRMRSVELSLATLDEAMTILQGASQADLPPEFMQTRRVLTDYIDGLTHIHLADASEAPPIPELKALRQVDLPLHEYDYIEDNYADLHNRRCTLDALVNSTGWEWSSIVTALHGKGNP